MGKKPTKNRGLKKSQPQKRIKNNDFPLSAIENPNSTLCRRTEHLFKSKTSSIQKLNVCTISASTTFAKYLYMFTQVLPEHWKSAFTINVR